MLEILEYSYKVSGQLSPTKIIKTVNEIPEEYRNETKKFVRDDFKVKKEKIDLSLLNKIFIPNMPTQTNIN